jgi:lysozyme
MNDLSQLVAADLRVDEDKRLKLYRCTKNKLSIGVGRNLEDNGISDDEAEYLLSNDLRRCIVELDRAMPWWRSLSETQQRGLLNMNFNLGLPKLQEFKNMLKALQAHDGQAASAQALNSLWAKQVGARSQRVAAMLRKG